jgi:Ca2+-binding EF-hand superfamily protein
MIRILISGLLAGLMSIGVAMADDREKSDSADATFKALDKNADQQLSKTETAGDKMLSQHFSAADQDTDGYLSKQEYTAHMAAMSDKPKKEY